MYTTKLLLDIMDDVMPRRQRLALAGVVAFLVIASIAGSLASRPAPAVVQPTLQVIYLLATPTPARAVGLTKEAAALAPIGPPSPTIAPTQAPAPEPVILVAPAPPEPTTAPEPTATPVPPWIGTRWTAR